MLVTRSVRPKDTIPTSSMADIAFLLLVFFLVTTVFPKDRGLTLMLPTDVTEVPASNVLHLLVSATGAVEARLGARPRGVPVATRDVDAVWRDAAAANPLLIAAVHMSPNAAYRHLVDMLDELQAGGARRVSVQQAERVR